MGLIENRRKSKDQTEVLPRTAKRQYELFATVRQLVAGDGEVSQAALAKGHTGMAGFPKVKVGRRKQQM